MKEQSINKGCITWDEWKMEQRCRHMSLVHDSSKACRLSGWETKDIMVSGQCFCALQSHKCAFYPSTHKQPPTPTIHTRTGMDGRCHLCDVLKTCLLSIKKLSILYSAFSTWWLFFYCHNGRVSSAISSAYYSFVVITDEKLKRSPFLFSILPIFLCPVCIQRSSHHCILIRDMSERLPQHVVSSDHPPQLFFVRLNKQGYLFNRYKLFLLDN